MPPESAVRMKRHTVILPGAGHPFDLRELVEHRDLYWFLVRRDFQIRFSQTLLGVAWVVIQPLFTVAAFSLFFGRLAGLPSEGLPYPLFVFAAQIAWQLFARVLATTSETLAADARLIQKVYFPRVMLVFACLGSALVELGVTLLLFVPLLVYFRTSPGWGLVALPFFVLVLLGAACGAGLFLATLNVRYRDVRHAVPFVAQIWFLVTPIAYPSSLVHGGARILYGLNPLVSVVDGFRWAFLRLPPPPLLEVLASVAVTGLVLAAGAATFKHLERTFADEA